MLLKVLELVVFDGDVGVWNVIRGSGPIRGLCISRAQVERVLGVDVGGSRDGRGNVGFGEDRLARRGRKGAIVRDEAARRCWT